MAKGMRELQMPMLNLPPYPVGMMGSPPDQGAIFLGQQDMQDMKKKISLLEENKKKIYALVMGQSSPKLESKILGSTGYKAANKDQDIVTLLLIIRGHCCQCNDCQQGTWALKQAKHCVSTFCQKYDMTNTDYVEYFNALVGVVETYGGVHGQELGLIRAQLLAQGVAEANLNSPDPAELKKAENVCREEYLPCMLLQGSNNTQFQ
jgi:hypothetical protein